MSETRWTKGPWWVCEDEEDQIIEILTEAEPDRIPITEIDVGFIEAFDTEQRANAHLIAAAPELAEAASIIVEYFDGGLDLDNKGNPLPDDQALAWVYLTHGDIRRLRAALAKAKGEG